MTQADVTISQDWNASRFQGLKSWISGCVCITRSGQRHGGRAGSGGGPIGHCHVTRAMDRGERGGSGCCWPRAAPAARLRWDQAEAGEPATGLQGPLWVKAVEGAAGSHETWDTEGEASRVCGM